MQTKINSKKQKIVLKIGTIFTILLNYLYLRLKVRGILNILSRAICVGYK